MMQKPESADLQVFGRYLLIQRLSRGGMGEVYLAKTGQIQGFEKLVVIKRILPHLSNNPEFSKRFTIEAEIAIKLSHVNIVPVLEVGRVQDEFFLALEHVEGRDLRAIQRQCVRTGRNLPVALALLIVRDLLNGLSYAHRREDVTGKHLQIVHCDISPPNVLVSYEGEVKIIDFGVAKSVIESEKQDEEGTTKMGFGKLGYMAPEQILKGHDIDPRTDLYSVGVILWELLTGKKLIEFDESTPYKEIARKVVLEPVPLPSQTVPGIDPALDRIVAVACAKKPEERFQTASEFRDAVQMALVKLAPTINNEMLGAFLKELFADEIEADRELLRQAKNVDLNPYRHELTSAMEETVSIAVVSEYQELTSPGQPITSSFDNELPLSNTARHLIEQFPTPATSSTPVRSGVHATPSYQGETWTVASMRRQWMWASGITAIVLTLIVVGFWLWQRPNTQLVVFSMPEMVFSLPVPRVTVLPPSPEPPPVEPPTNNESNMANQRTPEPVMHAPPLVTMNPPAGMIPTMAPEMTPAPMPPNPAGADDAREAQFKARYARLARMYNEFRQAHGDILAPQWSDLRNHLFNKKNTPDYYNILEQKILQLENLMKQHAN